MQIYIELPSDFVKLQTEQQLQHEIRLSYALWAYKAGKVTIAKAAELAGMDLYDFMKSCKENQIPVIDITRNELLEELDGMPHQ